MAKKPPTFGQHPYDPENAPAQSTWEPIHDLTHLQEYDGVLVAGINSLSAVQVQSQFMFPEQTKKYAEWALNNPTMDPRAWQPLAVAGISPQSTEGANIGAASLAAQVGNNTHDTAIGSTQQVKPSGVWASQTSPFGPTTPTVSATQPQATEQPDTPLLNLMNGVNEIAGDVASAASAGVRAVQYGLMSGGDAIQAVPRGHLGSEEAMQAVDATYRTKGLSDEDIRKARVWAYNQTSSGNRKDWYDALPPETRTLVDSYVGEINKVPETLPTITSQTPLGQIIENPSLLTEDSGLLAGNAEVYIKAEEQSLKAFDMRTLDEIARGVKPKGWTPGRGIAHVWFDPDSQEFATLSGIIDFSSNLAGDPVNMIPLNAIGGTARGASDLVNAMAGGRSPLGQVRRGMKVDAPQMIVETTGAPSAVITAAEKAAVDEYTSTKFLAMNRSLRSDSELGPMTRARSEALDSLTTKGVIDEETILYRSIDAPDLVAKKGRVFVDKGYSSTSRNQDDAVNWIGSGNSPTKKVLRIQVPAGTAGIDVGKVLGDAAPQAGEFILPRGSKFKVTGVDGKFVDVVLRNPQKATGFSEVSGGLAAARPGARGEQAVAAVEGADNVADRVSDLGNGTLINHATGEMVTRSGAHIVMSEPAWNFLNSGRGKAMVNDLVNEQSAIRIMARSGWRIDAALASTLADARTVEQVRSAIGTRMGFDLNDPRSLSNFGSNKPAIFKDTVLKDHPVLNYLRKAPWAKPFDLEDVDNTITQVTRFARGARMKFNDIEPYLNDIIRADGNGEKSYAAIYGTTRVLEDGVTTEKVPGLLDAVATHLSEDLGIDKHIAVRVTTAFQGGLDDALRNFVNTGLIDAMGTSMDGMVGSAMLDSELLTRAAVLPDYRTVRELSGAVGRVLAGRGKAEELNVQATNLINSATSAWKSAVLVRPAYVLREVGEMAVAASLGGYDGILTNPGAFLGLVLGTVAQKEASTSAGRLAQSITRGALPSAHFDALTERAASGASSKALVAARKGVYYGASTPVALANYLHLTEGMRLLFPSLDPKWARVNGDGLYANLNDFMKTGDSSTLENIYRGFAAVSGNFNVDERGMGRSSSRYVSIASQERLPEEYTYGLIDKLAALAADGDMRNLANSGVDFRRAVNEFVFSGRRDRKVTAGAKNFAGKSDEQYMQDLNAVLQRLTGGDEELLKAVATGGFGGNVLRKSNKSLVDHIKGMLADPAKAKSLPPTMRFFTAKYDQSALTRINDAVTQFFDFTGETSDLLQRGPLFREAYAREVQRLIPSMSPEAHAEAVAALRKAGDNALARRIENAGTPGGTLQTYEVDHLAAGFARKEQQRLFYNAHERQNYAVALRTLMPFAQATFNTIRRWGQFSMQNPQLMYRTMKPLNYGMQPGSAAIYGALGDLYGEATSTALYDPSSYGWDTPDNRHNSADGFFYTDNYGDRKFSYPLIGVLAQYAGIPQGAMNETSLSGTNVAGTSIQPGFGPAMTLPASFFGQDLINRDDPVGDAMRFMFPYGLPKGSLFEKIGFSFAPSWMAKIAKGSDDSGSVANLAVKMQGVLMDSGKYDLTSSIDQQRLAEDSAELSKRLFIWNSVIGATTPSTINTKALIKAKPTYGYAPSDDGKIVEAILAADPNDTGKAAQRWIIQDKLKQEWDKYTGSTGSLEAYRDGVLNFIHDHGASALFSVLPGTTGNDGVTPTQATNDVWHFFTTEPEAYRQNRDVIGLFFAGGNAFIPGDTSATGYASPLYTAQKDMGERVQQEPSDHIRAAMSEYGWTLYNPKKLEIEKNPTMTRDEKAAAKDLLTREIRDLTDGAWTGKPLDSGKTARLMERLRTAVTDETVQTLNSAPFIKDYMDYRDEIFAEMTKAGTTTNLSSKANEKYAIKLIDRAKGLIRADPTGAFNNAWNRLFINEFGSE